MRNEEITEEEASYLQCLPSMNGLSKKERSFYTPDKQERTTVLQMLGSLDLHFLPRLRIYSGSIFHGKQSSPVSIESNGEGVTGLQQDS